MSKRVLFILTSNGTLGDTGGKTGTWLEELAGAYYPLIDAGNEADIASVQGGEAPIDAASLEEPWLTAACERFLADASAMAGVRATTALSDINAKDYDAIYMVGGAGTAWDFPGNADLAALVEAMDRQNGVIAAVCHGVLGLTDARSRSGEPLVSGRRVTGISNREEILTTYDQVVPVLPENRLGELGGLYSSADEPFEAHVVVDGRLVTGQNPASAPGLATAIMRLFEHESAHA